MPKGVCIWEPGEVKRAVLFLSISMPLVPLCPVLAQAPEPIAIKSVRQWPGGSGTRIAIETSGEVKYRLERLDKPDRLLIDIPDSRMAMTAKGLHTMEVEDKLVTRIRVAMNQPTVTRVVLDVSMPVAYDVTQLANPPRLIVEVRPAGQKKPEPAVISQKKPETPPAPVLAPAPKPVEQPKAPEPKAAESRPAEPKPAEPKAGEPREELPLATGPDAAAPKPAKPLSGGRNSLTRTLGLKLGKVVIDAGHGGHDQGTAGPSGLLEKDLALDVALRLGALLEQRLGTSVVYTRTTDVFLPLEERTTVANEAKADLFLSIHANATRIKGISGAETYYLNFATSKADMDVAARENAGTNKSIAELRELIQKIALREKSDESREFAARLQNSLATTWSKMNDTARNRGVKRAPFVVLIGASMPSVLSEIGFISNAKDEALLKKADQRQRIAEALFKGINQYASGLSQLEVAQTRRD
jgi:N-acetylmuramoyl-L-alanine amidase